MISTKQTMNSKNCLKAYRKVHSNRKAQTEMLKRPQQSLKKAKLNQKTTNPHQCPNNSTIKRSLSSIAFPAKPQKNQKIPENNGKIVMQNSNSIKKPLEWLDVEAVEATTIEEVTIIVEATAAAIKVAANIGAATKEAAVVVVEVMAVVVVTAGAVTIIQVATMVSTEGLLVMVITTEVDEDAEITVNVDNEPAVKVAEEIGEINERIR